MQAAAGPALFGAGGRGAAVALLADVAALLALGRPAAVRALEDLRRLLQLALDAALPLNPSSAAQRAGPSSAAALHVAETDPASGALDATPQLGPSPAAARGSNPSAAAPVLRGADMDPASGATAEQHPPSGHAGSSASAAGAPHEVAYSMHAPSASAGPCKDNAAGPAGEAAAAAPGSRVAAAGRPPGTRARNPTSKAAPNPRPGSRGRRRLQAAERKLFFFLSWANEAPGAMYRALAEDVRRELARHGEGLTQGSAQGAGSGAGGAGLGVGAAGLAGAARGAAPRGPGHGAGAQRRTLVQEL